MSDLFDIFTGNRGVPRRKSRSTVKHNALDDGVLQDITDKAELFRREVEAEPVIDLDGKERPLDNWSDFVGDAFRTLHTNEDPGVLDAEEILPSHEPIRRVMQRFIGSEEFKAMKPDTTHDEIASAFGSMRAAPKLRALATSELKSLFEDAKQAEKCENRIERAETKLEDLREQARQMHEQGQPIPDDLRDQINEQVKRKANARHDLAKVQQDMANKPVTTGAAQVIQEAAEEAKKGVDVVRSLPGMGRGQTKKMKADDALRLANLFAENPMLFKIAQMLGRIVRDMKFKRARRMQGGVEEVVDVELGNNLPQVLPAQLMHMRHRLLKRWFLRRYVQASLLQRERRGTTEAGRGPLVVVVDESASMGETRFVWAKALCMAIISIARREKRDAAVVAFSSAGQTEVWEFPWKEPMDPERIVDMAAHNFRGGTSINEGLERARDVIAKDERFNRADCILITDGEDYEGWSDNAQKLCEDLADRSVRVHGIQVGGPPSAYLQGACENVASAMDLTGANGATDMLAENIN